MDNKERLREAVRKYIKKMLDEISTTGNIAGYLTPNAFVGDKHSNMSRTKRMAKRIGYTLTNRGKNDVRPGDKLKERYERINQVVTKLNENYYYQYRNDPSKKPHQKIGEAISEVNKQLKLIERILRMNDRLKREYGISNEALWKRTNHQMMKLEGKLTELAGKIREMRG